MADTWWARPEVQQSRVTFVEVFSERQTVLRPRSFSTAHVNILMHREELHNKRDISRRIHDKPLVVSRAKTPVAKIISRSPSLFVCTASQAVQSCSCNDFEAKAITPRQNTEAQTHMTLTRRNSLKNGGATYGIAGLVGLIVLRPGLLAQGATPPETIEVTGVEFAEPNAEATAKAAERADRKAKRAAAIGERAVKAQERAQKAVERANKLAAQAAKVAGTAAPSGGGEADSTDSTDQ